MSTNIKKKNSKGKIDRVEALNWVLFTIAYALFVGFLYGYVSTQVTEITYPFGIPFSAQQAVVVFGFAMWGIMSLFLNMKFRRE